MINLDPFMSVAEEATSTEIFAELDKLAQSQVGAIIFTCSTFDPSTNQAKRVHTNQPEAYPLSGLKDVPQSHWTDTVLLGGDVFVANTIGEIADVFPDHALIARLGCGSALNLPIKLCGSILGTMNLLNETGYFNPTRVKAVADLKPAATMAFSALNVAPSPR